jgi:hypothetical protein
LTIIETPLPCVFVRFRLLGLVTDAESLFESPSSRQRKFPLHLIFAIKRRTTLSKKIPQTVACVPPCDTGGKFNFSNSHNSNELIAYSKHPFACLNLVSQLNKREWILYILWEPSGMTRKIKLAYSTEEALILPISNIARSISTFARYE